jgi:hypothetical protein
LVALPLRLIAILSNVLFVAFGYAQHIYPVLFLHVALLPIDTWRLVTAQTRARMQSAGARQLSVSPHAPQPYALWFVVGLLAGLIGSFAVLAMTVIEPI